MREKGEGRERMREKGGEGERLRETDRLRKESWTETERIDRREKRNREKGGNIRE